MTRLNQFDTISAFAAATASAVARAVLDVLATKPVATLAVPGGSTARIVLPAFALNEIPWHRVQFILSDERWVPFSHPDSNEALASNLLGDLLNKNIYGFYIERTTPEAALPNLIADLKRPDVILLGMGEDGHIASLFPGDPANKSSAPLATVFRPDHRRITLTPSVISDAGRVILACAGASKSAVIKRAVLYGSTDELPVRHALNANADVFIGP